MLADEPVHALARQLRVRLVRQWCPAGEAERAVEQAHRVRGQHADRLRVAPVLAFHAKEEVGDEAPGSVGRECDGGGVRQDPAWQCPAGDLYYKLGERIVEVEPVRSGAVKECHGAGGQNGGPAVLDDGALAGDLDVEQGVLFMASGDELAGPADLLGLRGDH
jgi:hypothetical protein